jgi:hypothetical protein
LGLNCKSNRSAAGPRPEFNSQTTRGTGSPRPGAGDLLEFGDTESAGSVGNRPEPLDYGFGETGPHGFHRKCIFHYIVNNTTVATEVKAGNHFGEIEG